MHVQVENMPDNARVWLYAANQVLNNEQQALIISQGVEFTSHWTAHQIPINASIQLLHHRFIVFIADVAMHQISGCGIDKSVQLVQSWEQQLGVELFNRLQVELLVNNNLVAIQKHQISAMLQSNQINNQTLVFDKTIQTLGELRQSFTKPLEKCWIYTTLNKASIQN